jgi:hypothetical protein
VFAIPYAGLVIALVARAEGDLDAAIALLNVTFFRRQHITVDTHGQDGRGPLVKEVNRRLAETWAGAPTLQHKLDAHQLLILPDLQLLSVPSATSVDPRLLRHALFRGEESTAEFSTVIRPPAANRSPRALVALRVSVTVVAGLAPHLVAGLELSTAQSIAGLARSREIRREAYDALQAARTIDPGDRGTPTDRAPAPAGGAPSLVDLGQRLGTAEYELSFGVRANTDIGLLVPVAEVTEYHAALSTIVGLDRGLQVSESLLGSLARAVEALRDRTTERARARQELVERRLALFAAALLLPGLVAATVAAVPHSTQGRVTLAMLMVSTVFVPALVYLAVQQRAESARTGSANRAAWMRDATMGASGGAQETARPASSAHSSAAR